MSVQLILIAEDDPSTIDSWKRDLAEFNAAAGAKVHFEAIFARTRAAAMRALETTRIDCAIIDLRLPADDPTSTEASEPTGNDVLTEILIRAGVPAAVYSGHTADLIDSVKASPIRVFQKRGGVAPEILAWLAAHEPLMSAMKLTSRQIARECTALFMRAIWPRWSKSWMNYPQDLLTSVLTRQVVAHAAEQLGQPPNAHHPDEFYVVPSLSDDRLMTGDLVREGTDEYVVVTPRCNLAQGPYPKHVLLARCRRIHADWKGLRRKLQSAEKDEREAAEIELRDYATQNHSISSHFLPPSGELGPWLVDFKAPRSVSASEIETLKKTRFAAVASQFVPNLVQRYAAYAGRIGQPELDVETLRRNMMAGAGTS